MDRANRVLILKQFEKIVMDDALGIKGIETKTLRLFRKAKDLYTEEKPSDISSVLNRFFESVKNRWERKGKLLGFKTGFPTLDSWADGFVPARLWVIGGPTSIGKTAVALNLALAACEDGARVKYFLFETKDADLAERMVANQSKLTTLKIRTKDMDDAEEKRFYETIGELSNHKLNILDSSQLRNVDAIAGLLEDNPADVVFIDHLDHLEGRPSDSEYERKTWLIYELQQIAKDLNCCMVVLSQLSIEQARATDRKFLSYKGSGGILDSSDVGIVIEGDLRVAGKNTKINVWKNRHGSKGVVDVDFDVGRQIIREYA